MPAWRGRLRGALLIAGLGGVLILIDVLGQAGSIAGAVLILLGTTLSAPYRLVPGATVVGWWSALATACALTAVGVPTQVGLETLGGLLAGAGAAIAIVAVVLALPEAEASPAPPGADGA